MGERPAAVRQWLQRSTQVILGAFVWDIINRDNNNPETFYSTPATTQLGQRVASLRNASHGADVIVRTSPPVNPNRPDWHIEGPLSGNLALIRDVHDTWVASEMFLAGHTRAMSLPAAKIIGEYQAALEAALQSPVPISALFKDTWHPCVPLVPALWVHLLPLMPRSLN